MTDEGKGRGLCVVWSAVLAVIGAGAVYLAILDQVREVIARDALAAVILLWFSLLLLALGVGHLD